MSTRPFGVRPPATSFLDALGTQMRVIGALLMREIHTRYGRDNIGYLWLIGEPMMLASVMASLHQGGHTQFGSDVKPVAFTVVGYTTFIMFRGIVNRAEGTLEANAPLLYHRMVTVLDICTARSLLEASGTFLAYVVLMSLLVTLGICEPPARPLYYVAAQALMFWVSWSQALILVAITHENPTISRLTHPYSYFMIPLSASFFQLKWLPPKFAHFLTYLPLPNVLELARYGQFRSCNLDYFDGPYTIAVCVVTTWIGLVAMRLTRRRVHL